MSTSHSNAHPIRYRVQFWDDPDVSYSCQFGVREAKRWAIDTARGWGGTVYEECSNGRAYEVWKPGDRSALGEAMALAGVAA